MRDMDADHEEAAVADARHHAAAVVPGLIVTCSRMMLSRPMTRARCLAVVFQILRLMADRGEGKDRACPRRSSCGRRSTTCERSSTSRPELDLRRRHGRRARSCTLAASVAPGSTTAVGWICAHRADSAVHDHGGEGRFGHELAVDHGLALELPDIAAVCCFVRRRAPRAGRPGRTGRRKRALSTLMK